MGNSIPVFSQNRIHNFFPIMTDLFYLTEKTFGLSLQTGRRCLTKETRKNIIVKLTSFETKKHIVKIDIFAVSIKSLFERCYYGRCMVGFCFSYY